MDLISVLLFGVGDRSLEEDLEPVFRAEVEFLASDFR